MKKPPRLVEVRQRDLKQNDLGARELRHRFKEAGVYVVSLASSPGSGKTAFLEQTLSIARLKYRTAALVGDLATENDALRLSRTHVPVKQITTGTIGHLDAEMVRNALDGWIQPGLELLFIENVGNLVCPSSYDLGENLRLVLMSVTEGEDKPLKYPTIYHTADVAIITKTDLAAAVEFEAGMAHTNIHAVRPGMEILDVSVKTGQGMEKWMHLLESHIAETGAGQGGKAEAQSLGAFE